MAGTNIENQRAILGGSAQGKEGVVLEFLLIVHREIAGRVWGVAVEGQL